MIELGMILSNKSHYQCSCCKHMLWREDEADEYEQWEYCPYCGTPLWYNLEDEM